MTTRNRNHPSMIQDREFWRGVFSPALLGIVLAGALIALVATFVLREEGAAARTKPAPYTYIGTPYQADRATLCPGDALVYTATLEIREPNSMLVIKTIATESGYNIPGWEQTRRTIYDQPSPPSGPIPVPERVLIPDLPPGRYHLLETRQLPDAAQDFYRVPFDVPGGCS